MLILRRACALAAIPLTLAAYAACTEPSNETRGAATNQPTVAEGVYVLEEATTHAATIALIGLNDDTHRYWLWKNASECQREDADASMCGEIGSYEADEAAKTIVLHSTLADGSVVTRSLPFAIDHGAAPIHVLDTALVNAGDGGALARGSATLVAGRVSIAGTMMRLIQRTEDLFKCQALDSGTGRIPGAADPATQAPNGVFTSGPFAPGGQYDPARIGNSSGSGSQTLYTTNTSTSHEYAMLSNSFPPGTTYAQANAFLQQFSAPTGPSLSGRGDDPNADKGWVADPVLNVPLGCVTMERGNGWARNTTQENHPLIGTITRYVVQGPNCTFRILTVGQGQGGEWIGGPIGIGLVDDAVRAARHWMNVEGGPIIFSDLDQAMLGYAQAHPPSPAGSNGCQ